MLNLILAASVTTAGLPADFDGKIKENYTLEEKIKVLEWRTDYLLKQNVALEAIILEFVDECAMMMEEYKVIHPRQSAANP